MRRKPKRSEGRFLFGRFSVVSENAKQCARASRATYALDSLADFSPVAK
jgi:hypothetical protein